MISLTGEVNCSITTDDDEIRRVFDHSQWIGGYLTTVMLFHRQSGPRPPAPADRALFTPGDWPSSRLIKDGARDYSKMKYIRAILSRDRRRRPCMLSPVATAGEHPMPPQDKQLQPMMILVAGPYRSNTQDRPEKIAANMRQMNEAALRVFRRGHIPITGESLALPLIELAGSRGIGDAAFAAIFHPLAERLVGRCDGCLRIGGPSSGADRMVALARQHQRAIFHDINDIPDLTA
jgi:hypothetical protein